MEKKDGEGKGSERRRDRRYHRALPVRVGHDHTEGLKAESINVSTRGLYCKVARYVQPFSKLKVALELPFVGREPELVECEGVVVRVEPEANVSSKGDYRLAIYFLNMAPQDARRIEEFISEGH